MGWFLYDSVFRHERVRVINCFCKAALTIMWLYEVRRGWPSSMIAPFYRSTWPLNEFIIELSLVSYVNITKLEPNLIL